MRLEDLDFQLPQELIAQRPAEPRDACLMLRLDRKTGTVSHHLFRELPRFLHPGDVLVLNDSKVLPARVDATKPTGGHVEILFLRPTVPAREESGETWEALARPSHRLREGLPLALAGGEVLELGPPLGDGRWLVTSPPGTALQELLERHGRMPLPPYIHSPLADPSEYQTVYAAAPGSAAAPTAGLHFTPELLTGLEQAGIEVVKVTLHVGLDTFKPISAALVEEHVIHREAYSISARARASLDRARREGRRLVAVGTTSVRVLETLYATGTTETQTGSTTLCGSTSVYITPGYAFRAVGALITNFHLPRTSLLALVMAFAGIDATRHAYRAAVEERYRFFSFGDAMFIDGEPSHG